MIKWNIRVFFRHFVTMYNNIWTSLSHAEWIQIQDCHGSKDYNCWVLACWQNQNYTPCRLERSTKWNQGDAAWNKITDIFRKWKNFYEMYLKCIRIEVVLNSMFPLSTDQMERLCNLPSDSDSECSAELIEQWLDAECEQYGLRIVSLCVELG